MLTPEFISSVISRAIPVIQNAGSLLLLYWKQSLSADYKKTGASYSLVSEADRHIESFLIKELYTLIPEAAILSEESGFVSSASEKVKASSSAINPEISPFCWVIDPLDGTTNFVHTIPYFCISVALTYHQIPILGIIYDPLHDELIYAIMGKGAYRTDTGKLPLVEDNREDNASAAKNYAHNLAAHFTHNSTDRKHLLILSSTLVVAPLISALSERTGQQVIVRHLGSAAHDHMLFATGQADILLFKRLEWWDVAAGMLIAREVGGRVFDAHGIDIAEAGFSSYIVARPSLYTLLIHLL